ncbi:hypothetical protein [Roseibium sp.]|uniref:hypothetical protein n=1 Tax=Roseibium sp. TaxID=1936156 RepID=UPI0039F09F1B
MTTYSSAHQAKIEQKLNSIPEYLHELIGYDFEAENWTIDGKPWLPITFEQSWQEHVDQLTKVGLIQLVIDESRTRFGQSSIDTLETGHKEQLLEFMSIQLQTNLLQRSLTRAN